MTCSHGDPIDSSTATCPTLNLSFFPSWSPLLFLDCVNGISYHSPPSHEISVLLSTTRFHPSDWSCRFCFPNAIDWTHFSTATHHLPSFSNSIYFRSVVWSHCCCCFSVAKSCLTLCNSINCSTLGFPILHYLLKFAQTPVHWVGDAIQPSHSLSPPFPPVFNLSQYQGLFQ